MEFDYSRMGDEIVIPKAFGQVALLPHLQGAPTGRSPRRLPSCSRSTMLNHHSTYCPRRTTPSGRPISCPESRIRRVAHTLLTIFQAVVIPHQQALTRRQAS